MLENLLILDLLSGLVIFVLINIHTDKADKRFVSVLKAYIRSTQMINYARGFFSSRSTRKIHSITTDQLEIFILYINVIVAASRIDLIKAFVDASNSVLGRDNKKELTKLTKFDKDYIDDMYKLYKDNYNTFMKEKEFLGRLIEISNLLERYKGDKNVST